MKKRILSALLISALMLSMTACGNSEKPSESLNSAEVTTTTIAPIPVYLPDVTDSGDFINGTYFFEQNGSYYAFNMVDKVFHEYEKKTCKW